MQIAQFQVECLPEVFKIHARAVYLNYLSHSQAPMQVPRRKPSSSLPRANTFASRSVMLVTEHSNLQGCMLMKTCFPSRDQERKNRAYENGYNCDNRSECQGGLAQEFLVTSCSHENFGRRRSIRSSQKHWHDLVP